MNRRTLITGLVSLIAAPAIVRCSSLMQVRGIVMPPGSGVVFGPWYGMGVDGFHELGERWEDILLFGSAERADAFWAGSG